ncbi:MAG: DNA-directed RNA polymerase, partial [Candidatus Pacearchaeota archaeon]
TFLNQFLLKFSLNYKDNMFYLTEVEDHVRVEPKHFGLPTKEAIEKQLNESFVDHAYKELGFVIAVISVDKIDNGVIIPGDGAAFYNSNFKLLCWKPELHEIVYGIISEITNFGAFMQIGPAQGMIHISQTMEDYVSLSKTGTLSGKATKRNLGKGDECIARIVAISFKGGEPKIGLTMRQPGLGKIDWIKEDKKKKEAAAKAAAKKAEKAAKKEKK